MITLHKIAEETRTLFKWSTISLLALISLILIFKTGINIKEYFYPTPVPPPTVSFGKLPQISFLPNTTTKSLSYTINTLSGTLPTFPDRVKIYQITQPQPNLLALKRAQERVVEAGFDPPATSISDTIYQWQTQSQLSKKLTQNILSFNFNLSTNFLNNQNLFNKEPLSENEAVDVTRSYVSKISLFHEDIDTAKTKITPLLFKDSQLVAATSISTTQVIRVDLYQKNIDNLPVYYPHPPFSTMNFLVAGKRPREEILEANFYHQIINETSATYPIITADEAFSQLKKANAYIAAYYGTDNQIKIKNVYLGYYLGEITQDYLMPIVIFEGNDGFFAYISAVKEEWINK